MDTVSVRIGRVIFGVFNPEGSANISVRIEGRTPPPAWAWVFSSAEPVQRGSTTQFDVCSNYGDLEVRITVRPQLGSVTVALDAARGRWVANYTHDATIDSVATSDGIGLEIGSTGVTGGFTQLGSTRVVVALSALP